MVHHGTDVDTRPSCRARWLAVPTAEARSELDSESEPQCEPEITIVIATRNRRGELLRTLGRIHHSSPGSPVIVVDNGSTDGTADAVRGIGLPGITVVEAGRNLGAAGRTLGVRRAATPYVAFSDDDSWWAPGAVARAAAAFDACPRLALVAARVLVGADERLDPTCRAMRHSSLPPEPDLPGPPVLGFLACAAVVRRHAYLDVGGFHHVLGIGAEEELLALDLADAGWGLAYLDDVVAHHHPSRSRNGQSRRRRHQANRVLITWLRRPARVVVKRTAAAALAGHESRRAVGDALAAIGVVLRERRVIAPALESRVRLLEASVTVSG